MTGDAARAAGTRSPLSSPPPSRSKMDPGGPRRAKAPLRVCLQLGLAGIEGQEWDEAMFPGRLPRSSGRCSPLSPMSASPPCPSVSVPPPPPGSWAASGKGGSGHPASGGKPTSWRPLHTPGLMQIPLQDSLGLRGPACHLAVPLYLVGALSASTMASAHRSPWKQ